MKATEIKHALRTKGIKLVDIAKQLDVSHVSVSLVISGRCTSRRIAAAIADAIGGDLEVVFPRYKEKE